MPSLQPGCMLLAQPLFFWAGLSERSGSSGKSPGRRKAAAVRGHLK
jgi:hypothetical protein